MKVPNSSNWFASLLCVGMLGACVEDEDVASELESAFELESASELESIAVVEVAPNHTLTFFVAEPDETFVTEVAPSDSTNILVQARAAGATDLEIFSAVAPDQPVPRELVQSHETTVAAQGREDAGVSALKLSANLETRSSSACTDETSFGSWYYFDAFYPRVNYDQMESFYSGSGGPTVFSIYDGSTTFTDFWGAGCNKDSGAKEFYYCSNGGGLFWSCTLAQSVAAGQTWTVSRTGSSLYHGVYVRYPYQVSGTARLAVTQSN